MKFKMKVFLLSITLLSAFCMLPARNLIAASQVEQFEGSGSIAAQGTGDSGKVEETKKDEEESEDTSSDSVTNESDLSKDGNRLKTGDNTKILIYFVGIIGSIIFINVFLLYKKKRRVY